MPRLTRTAAAFAVVASCFAAACDVPPSGAAMQWVARDAWDPTCAEQAIIEKFSADNKSWKIKGEVYQADVVANFKLVNKCQSGLPLVGKSYEQFEVATFTGKVEMSRCKKGDEEGWALPGKESSRCWTGPTLLAK